MSAGFLLAPQERERFASWLELQAATSRALLEQMEKLGPAGKLLAVKETQELHAYLIIAAILRNTHDESIG